MSHTSKAIQWCGSCSQICKKYVDFKNKFENQGAPNHISQNGITFTVSISLIGLHLADCFSHDELV